MILRNRKKASTARGRTGRRRCRGFTLIEMVTTIAITSIVLTATSGLLGMMAQTGTRLQSDEKIRTAAALGMYRMRSELRTATTLIRSTPQSIRFTHPDVTGDDAVDSIEYAWSGTRGDPLGRSVNDEAPRILIEDCQKFTISLDAVYEKASAFSTMIESGMLNAVNIHLETPTSTTFLVLDGTAICANRPELGGFDTDDLPIALAP